MPLVTSNFKTEVLLSGGHRQTVLGNLSRRLPPPRYQRERITTSDNDFLDLDWLRSGAKNLVVVSHGLEGSSQSVYVRALVAALPSSTFDVLVWNFRGCSGEPNLLPSSYHSGFSQDLREVLRHAERFSYSNVFLVGFSVGGNIVLKLLGEDGAQHSGPPIRSLAGAVAISVPCNLEESAAIMALPSRRIYMQRFLKDFRQKLLLKSRAFPDRISLTHYSTIRNFFDFDTLYTAPLHGFADAITYWRYASSLYYLETIRVPTLLINAADDPFYGPLSIPFEIAKKHRYLSLEVPPTGGHVGFVQLQTILSQGRNWWVSHRIRSFFADLLGTAQQGAEALP